MSATLGIDGSAAGAIKAVADLNAALDKTEKTSDKAAAASKKLAEDAKRVAASVDPVVKYNQQIERLKELVQRGGLEVELARKKAEEYGRTLYENSEAGKAAAASAVAAAQKQKQAEEEKKAAALASAAAQKEKLRELAAETKKAATEEERLKNAARALVEQVNPLAAYNRKMAELADHVRRGRVTTEEAVQVQRRYREELQQSTQAGDQFGGAIGSMVAGYFSLSAAASLATKAITDAEAARQKAADNAVRARQGLGSLSQLAAAGAPSKEVASRRMASLVAEARGFVATGAAADENEAGNLLFELASAGLNRRDRSFAAQVRAKGTLQNVAGAAQSFDALRTALGEGEVGDFRSFLSKALQGASVAPGSFEQLPVAAAQAGGSAKALGVSDEFLLAATALIGKQRGSVSEGGTGLAAFLKQVEQSGIKGIGGVGGIGIVERIASLPESQQGFGGVLGDKAEAISSFRVLRDNLAQLRDLESSIVGASQMDLAGIAIGLPENDKSQRATQLLVEARGRRDRELSAASAARENLLATAREERLSSTGSSAFTYATDLLKFGAFNATGNEDTALQTILFEEQRDRKQGLAPRLTDKTLSAIEEHLRDIRRAQKSSVTTRQN